MLEKLKSLLLPKSKNERKSRTLFVPKSSKAFWKDFIAERKEGEAFESYQKRRKKQTGVLKFLRKRSLTKDNKPVLCGMPYSKYHR